MGQFRAGEAGTPGFPRILCTLATLGPVGRVPRAPGTAGSLVALGGWLVIGPGAGWGLWAALVGLALVAVAAGGEAARMLGTADPPSVVIDEILGMTLALALAPGGLGAALTTFVAFRVLDMVKPYPVRWLERFPGGCGIVADDVGAALYAASAVRLAWLALGLS